MNHEWYCQGNSR